MNESIEQLCGLFMKRMRIEADDGSEAELVAGFIEAGTEYIKEIACGSEIDFITDMRARELLYNYVFYARNECLAEYEKNYGQMLRSLRNRARVKQAKEGTENAEA